MQKTFKANGTFQSYYDAVQWLEDNGYSHGSMCGDKPMGIMKGDWSISKWKNLTNKQIKELDGTMTSSDFREGDVIINIKEVTE